MDITNILTMLVSLKTQLLYSLIIQGALVFGLLMWEIMDMKKKPAVLSFDASEISEEKDTRKKPLSKENITQTSDGMDLFKSSMKDTLEGDNEPDEESSFRMTKTGGYGNLSLFKDSDKEDVDANNDNDFEGTTGNIDAFKSALKMDIETSRNEEVNYLSNPFSKEKGNIPLPSKEEPFEIKNEEPIDFKLSVSSEFKPENTESEPTDPWKQLLKDMKDTENDPGIFTLEEKKKRGGIKLSNDDV